MTSWLYFDNLSWLMIGLISFVGLNVAVFSRRYLNGDRKQSSFYINLVVLILSAFIMVSADHLLLLFIAWSLSNLFLTRLMLHKCEWSAAFQSSRLAWRNFLIGLGFLAAGFLALYYATSFTSIQQIVHSHGGSAWVSFSAICILIAAMTQSALWPFHKWLLSSLNSPTPVSAMMHAGLVNGGGFILARFANIFIDRPVFLTIIFVVGIFTAILGTLWKLMQSDVKRMLACSTMGQMGFMVAQCGLGLFPAAIAHLCWHGLFKAYLFLNSATAAQEKRHDFQYPPKWYQFVIAFVCGFGAAYGFSYFSGKSFFTSNTNLLLIVVALIAGAQFALMPIRTCSWKSIPLVFMTTCLAGSLYGVSVRLLELIILPVGILAPQPLNSAHFIAIFALTATWGMVILNRHRFNRENYPQWVLRFYVAMLNASQPHKKTITAHRNEYQV